MDASGFWEHFEACGMNIHDLDFDLRFWGFGIMDGCTFWRFTVACKILDLQMGTSAADGYLINLA